MPEVYKRDDGARDMDVDAVLRHARQIDPGFPREAISRYVSEIEQMADALQGIDPGGFDGLSAYSPAWETTRRAS